MAGKARTSNRIRRYVSEARLSEIDVVRAVLATGPAMLFLRVALTEPVGHMGWNNRSLAGFFQTLAYLEWGPEALLRLHPEESLSSAFHLHSLLSTPFVAVGLDTGGRLVSLAAMALAAYWIGGLLAEWRTPQAGWFAAVLLWFQPWVVQRAYMWTPEALSICLTTGAVYYLIRHYERGGGRDYVVAHVLAALAITTHLWEAIVGLPLVVVSLSYWKLRNAVESAVVVLLSTLVVMGISRMQSSRSTINWWAVWGDWSVLLTPEYWAVAHLSTVWDVLGEFIYLPSALVATFASVYLWYSRSERVYAVLASWLLAGLVIPVVLARGNVDHPYLIWGLVAPVTAATALFVTGGALRLRDSGQWMSLATIVVGAMAVLYILSAVYGAGYVTNIQHDGIGEHTFADESQRIGEELQERGIERSELTFVGDWYQQYDWGRQGYVSDILFVYAGAEYLPSSRRADLSEPSPNRAHITEDPVEAQSEWCILRDGNSLSLQRCATLDTEDGRVVGPLGPTARELRT